MKRKTDFICLILLLLAVLCSCADSGQTETTAAEQTAASQSTQPVSEVPYTVTVTFPEGMTLCEIAEKLEKSGVCSADEFMLCANDEAIASLYSFYSPEMKSKHRAFLLEGYIFPDTYEFYYGEAAPDALKRFLDNAETKLEGCSARAKKAGFTLDEIITAASIIQEEALPEQMKSVSAVLHNRLARGMQLQCDVTINYIENSVKPYIDGDKDRFSEYYNTYKCPALPYGPICSPGMQAIESALEPSDEEWLYFVTDKDDPTVYYYAADYDGHTENCEKAGWQ